MLFFMNWMRFTNLLFGARIQINEPDRVQFETNEPIEYRYWICLLVLLFIIAKQNHDCVSLLAVS